MVLPYENPKWEKLRKEISQVGYHFEDIPSMDGYVKRLRKSAMRKEDYAHYFASISLRYHSWVWDRYLMNPNDLMLADDTYRSGVAGVISQQLGGLDLPQWENAFATALYELVALDRTDAEYFTNKKSVLSCIAYVLENHILPQMEAMTEDIFGSRLLERSRNDSDFFLAHQTVSLEYLYYPGTPEAAIYGVALWRLGRYEEGTTYLTYARQKYRDWLKTYEQERDDSHFYLCHIKTTELLDECKI